MKSLPTNVEPYKRTRQFDQSTVPAGLLRRHNTKPGVWGRICIVEGEILYRILEPAFEEILLRPGLDGIVEPTQDHELEPRGPVEFFVEFLKVRDSS